MGTRFANSMVLGLGLPLMGMAQERPQGRGTAPWERIPPDAIVLRVSRDGAVRLNDQPLPVAALDTLLVRVYAPRPDRTLYLVMAAEAPDTTTRRVYRAAARAGAELVPLRRDPRARQVTRG